jgi:hypothetical protein
MKTVLPNWMRDLSWVVDLKESMLVNQTGLVMTTVFLDAYLGIITVSKRQGSEA